MRGFFKNDKLERLFVAINAESIYFKRDSGKVAGMQRSLSSRIRTIFKNGSASEVTFLTKPENRYIPIAKVTEEDKELKGFIWKPKERPVSKESIIPSHTKKPHVVVKHPPKVKPDTSSHTQPDSLNNMEPDSLKGHPKLHSDSTQAPMDTITNPQSKVIKGGLSKPAAGKPIAAAQASVKDATNSAATPPAIKAPADTTANKTTGNGSLPPLKAVADTAKNPAKKTGS
jgi:hypothetical protein